MNRQNAAQPVAMFKNSASGNKACTPNDAVQQDVLHWSSFWQQPGSESSASSVLQAMRDRCRAELRVETECNMYDILEFTAKDLFKSVSKYKKVSKGSDHWLASEIAGLPKEMLEPLPKSTDIAVTSLTWPHQLMLNLMPELGKERGGFRTIAKTPKLYRLSVRTRKSVVQRWENSLVKGYDTACKGSSALMAAADRAVFVEIAVRNNKKVCGTFF